MGKSDQNISYTQSPEQEAIWNAIAPSIASMFATPGEEYISGYETKREWVPPTPGRPNPIPSTPDNPQPDTIGGSPGYWEEREVPVYATSPLGQERLWEIPSTPSAPVQGKDYMTYNDYYNQQNLSPPSAQGYMPTADWYNSLSPEVMAGLNAPWDEARNQMFETMGTSLGSARGGWSGAGGAALGEFEAKRATQLPLQAWQMSQPGLEKQWQSNFGDYLAGQERTLMDYQNYLNPYQQDYGMQQNVWTEQARQASMPYDIIPGLLGGTYSNPVVPGQQGPNAVQMVGTGLTAAGTYPSAASPYLIAGGTALNIAGSYM